MYTYTKKTVSLFTLIFILLFTLQASAQWGSKGPYGGSVKCLTVIDTFVYVGTAEGGLYRSSSKNALSWKALNNVMTTGKINSITALGTTIVVGSSDQGIFISADKGASWIKKNSGLSNPTILSLTVSGTTLYAGTNGGGIFKSTNSGDSWTAINTGLSNLTINTLASTSTVVVAGTNGGGIFYSINGGSNWTAGNTGLSNLYVSSLAAAGNNVLASTKGGGVFSADASTFTWAASNNGLTNINVQQVIIAGSTAYAATAGGVFSSATSSISWTAENTGLPEDTIKAIAVFENKLIAGTFKSGLYTSELNAISWIERNTSFNNLKTYALYANGNLIIVATEKGVYISRNQEENYIPSNNGLTDSLYVNCLAFAGTKLLAGTKNNFYESPDTGKTWINTHLPLLDIRVIAANTDKVVVATYSNASVYISALPNISWEHLSSGFPSNTTIKSLLLHGNDIYSGTNTEGVFIYKSGAQFWTYFNTGMHNQHVASMSIVGNKIVAATPNNGIFVSNLSSANWTLSNSGLPDVRITSMASAAQSVLVGYKGGVYTSSNNATSWQSPTTLLNIPPYTQVTNIAVSTDKIFISTPYNSIYSITKAELPLLTGILNGVSTLNNNLLVTPNPNNGTFKVDYSSLNVQISELSIYNYTGQLMDAFSDGEERISVNYPPGIYMVRLKTKTNEIFTQKMIIQ